MAAAGHPRKHVTGPATGRGQRPDPQQLLAPRMPCLLATMAVSAHRHPFRAPLVHQPPGSAQKPEAVRRRSGGTAPSPGQQMPDPQAVILAAAIAPVRQPLRWQALGRGHPCHHRRHRRQSPCPWAGKACVGEGAGKHLPLLGPRPRPRQCLVLVPLEISTKPAPGKISTWSGK